MMNVQLLSYRLKKDRLEVKIDNQTLTRKSYSFRFVDRKTNEAFEWPAEIKRHESESVLSVSLSVVNFNENVKQGIFDVLIQDDIGIAYTPVLENLPLEDKAYKYSVNSYQINYKSSAIPYLTTKNSLSIVFGNSSEIIKTFTSEIKLKATALSLQFINQEIHLVVTSKSIEDTQSFMVIFENRSNKKSIILKHEVIEKNFEHIGIKASLEEDFNYSDRYDLYIQFRKGHKVFKSRIGFKDSSVKRGENKFFDPIKINNSYYILPYITTSGEISCLAGDNVSVAKSLGAVVKKENIDIDKFVFHNGTVELHLCEGQLDKVNSFREKKFLIQGSSHSIYREVSEQAVHINDRGTVTLQVDKIFNERTYENNEKWTFLLRLEKPHIEEIEFEDVNLQDTFLYTEDSFSNGTTAVALRPLETSDKKDSVELVEEDNKEILLCSFVLNSNWMSEPVVRYSKPYPIDETQVISCISNDRKMMFIIGDEQVYSSYVHTKISTLLEIDDLRIRNTSVSFGFLDDEILLKNSMKLFFRERKTKEEWEIPFNVTNNRVEFDIQSFVDLYIDQESRWDTYAQLCYSNVIEEGKLGLFSENVKPASGRYFTTIEKNTANEEMVESSEDEEELTSSNVVTPYLTVKNELSIVIRPELNLFNEKYKSKTSITHFQMHNGILKWEAVVEVSNVKQIEVKQIRLKLRNKATLIEYDLEVNESKLSANKTAVSFEIDPKKFQWQPFYWDMFAVVQVDQLDEVIYIKLKNPSKLIADSINTEILKYEHNFDNSFMLYPYITQDRSLALCYRQRADYETAIYKYKEKLAYLVYKLFKRYFDRKNIWLGYEKFSSTAQDNGYYFFEYCYKNNKNRNFYYIIKSDTPDYRDLKKMKNKVIKYMSFKHMLYLFAAKLLISSESKGHSYDIRIQKGELKKALDSKKFVFLQHGVTALKKVDYVFKKTRTSAVNLFVATSEYEKNIIENYFGYDNKEIIVTGFSRWDALKDKSQINGSKEVFIMPTWRAWMDGIPEEEFLKTDYYRNYSDLLQSTALYEILEKEDVWVNFLLHPKFIEHVGHFKVLSNRVKIHEFGSLKVNEILMGSKLLITDYSSVAWEMYYMNKPTIFYQFDANKYQKYQGSYLDLDHELFGDRAFNNSELLYILQDYIQRDFKEKDKYAQMRSKYFKYIDDRNSERIFNAIISNQKSLSLSVTKNHRNEVLKKLRSQKLIQGVWRMGSRNKITKKIMLKIKNQYFKK